MKKNMTIGDSREPHAHALGPMSSTGPVMRCPQQQNTFLVGQTSYARTIDPCVNARACAPAETTAPAVARATADVVGTAAASPLACVRARLM